MGFMKKLGFIKKELYEKVVWERDELRKRVGELEAKMADLEETRKELEKRVKDLEKAVADLEKERDELRKKIKAPKKIV